jgi:hypothetical protein
MVSLPVTKQLFALSRNECAFAGCARQLVRDDGIVAGKICHIRASGEKGPRHDKTWPPEQLDSFENLLLLCQEHHDLIDKGNVLEWTIERLEKMKATHEAGGKGEVRGDEDRVCGQLIENQTIYQQGIHVGAVEGDIVSVAGDMHVHHYPAPPTPPIAKGTSKEREAFAKLRARFENFVLDFCERHNFASPFMSDSFQVVEEMVEALLLPECEFLDPDLDRVRRDLLDAVVTFREELMNRTFPDPGSQYQRLKNPTDHKLPDDPAKREREFRAIALEVAVDAQVLNDCGAEVAEWYRAFVTAGRRQLEE